MSSEAKAPAWLQSAVNITHVLLRFVFIVECGIACFLCVIHAFKVRHHPHPRGYLCAKFHFFRCLRCWASPWRKIAYSITHLPSSFDVSGTKLSLRNLLHQNLSFYSVKDSCAVPMFANCNLRDAMVWSGSTWMIMTKFHQAKHLLEKVAINDALSPKVAWIWAADKRSPVSFRFAVRCHANHN